MKPPQTSNLVRPVGVAVITAADNDARADEEAEPDAGRAPAGPVVAEPKATPRNRHKQTRRRPVCVELRAEGALLQPVSLPIAVNVLHDHRDEQQSLPGVVDEI
jgi:hypothetical protein